MLKKFIVQYCHANVVGTDMAENCFAKNDQEAAEMFYDAARDWAEQFGGEDVDNDFDEEDCNWECWAEEYNPEKHDGLAMNSWNWANCHGI